MALVLLPFTTMTKLLRAKGKVAERSNGMILKVNIKLLVYTTVTMEKPTLARCSLGTCSMVSLFLH